ncbi:unnamed protein product, partial [Coregonus sp. 'balchen']
METCEAIERRMLATYLPRPTEEVLRQTAQEFKAKWYIPNCLGSVDRKHVSDYQTTKLQNKGTCSVVLLALLFNWGISGENSDGGVYANSPLGRGMVAKTLQVPQDAFLPGGEELRKIPYTMVGAVFPLKPYLMRPNAGHNKQLRERRFQLSSLLS